MSISAVLNAVYAMLAIQAAEADRVNAMATAMGFGEPTTYRVDLDDELEESGEAATEYSGNVTSLEAWVAQVNRSMR